MEEDIQKIRIKDVTASEVIQKNFLIFGKDTVFHLYPHVIDGLKAIQRRIVWTASGISGTANLGKFISETMEIHTSGDASVYGALVRISQDFVVGHPLIEIEGDGGKYSDEKAAAPRYISAKITEFSKDLFLNRITKEIIPMKYTKELKSKEPEYFIPCIPLSLIMNHASIAIGFNSVSPQLNLSDVCDLVCKHIDTCKNTLYPSLPDKVFAKYIIPDFPINNYLLNREELLKEYSKGNYNHPIKVSGKMTLKNNTLVINSVGFGNPFLKTCTSVLDKFDEDKNFWLNDHIRDIKDLSNARYPAYTLTFKNNTNIFEILPKLRSLFRINSYMHPVYIYTKGLKLFQMNPISLFEAWYDERIRSVLAGIKYRQNDLIIQRLEKLARLHVCDHTDEVIRIIRNSENEPKVIANLINRFKDLTMFQATILSKIPLGSLHKQSKIQLLDDVERIEASIKTVLHEYKNLENKVYVDAEFMKKKYGKKRMTTFIEDQIGYVYIKDKGIIQFDSLDEFYTIVDNNSSGNKKLYGYMYHSYFPNRKATLNNKYVKFKFECMDKEFYGTNIIEYPNKPVSFYKENSNISIINGVILPKKEEDFILYTTKNFYGIRRDGGIVKVNSDDLSSRKSLSKGTHSELIYALPENVKNMIVIHMHEKSKNVLRLDKILYDDTFGSCKMLPTKGNHILDVVSIKDNLCIINIPESCIDRLGIEMLVMENIGDIFKTQNSVNIELNKSNKEFKIKRHSSIPKIGIFHFRGE